MDKVARPTSGWIKKNRDLVYLKTGDRPLMARRGQKSVMFSRADSRVNTTIRKGYRLNKNTRETRERGSQKQGVVASENRRARKLLGSKRKTPWA